MSLILANAWYFKGKKAKHSNFNFPAQFCSFLTPSTSLSNFQLQSIPSGFEYGTTILAQMLEATTARCELSPSEFSPQLSKTIDKLKVLLGSNNPELVPRKTKNGVEIFGYKPGKLADGLPVARCGTATLQVPVEDAAACWWHFDARQDWDSVNTTASQVVGEEGADVRLVYLKAKAKPMISPRDFAFRIHRVPPSAVGAPPGSKVFVQVSCSEAVPAEPGAVRAVVNSLLVLEPRGATTTRATYAVEMDARGWLPNAAVNAAADDLPLTMGVMRDYLEAKLGTDPSLSEEEAARTIVARRRSEALHERDGRATLVRSVAASREDLLATQAMLKKRLKQLKTDEKELGVKLDDLRRKIENDLKTVNQRLRQSSP